MLPLIYPLPDPVCSESLALRKEPTRHYYNADENSRLLESHSARLLQMPNEKPTNVNKSQKGLQNVALMTASDSCSWEILLISIKA